MPIISAENTQNTSSDIIKDNDITQHAEITKKESNITKTSTTTTKTASKISIDSQSLKYNTTTNFNAKVTDTNGNNIKEGKVVFKINGNTIGNSNVTNGVASLTYKLADMTPKTYDLTVKYGENSKYYESSTTTKLTLLKHDSKITVINQSVITRNTVKLTAKIIDTYSANNAQSGKVAFKINGKTVGYSNVTEGVASYAYVTTKLSAKKYNITATFGGNHLLNSNVSKAGYLNVSAIPTKLTVENVSGYSDSVILKANIVEKSNLKAVPNGTVVFKINDKTVGNSTISNGKTSFTYNATKLTRGTYKITAILKPTSTYASSQDTGNLTIIAEEYFTFNQIKKAAVDVRTQLEANKIVNTVQVNNSKIALSEFLALMIQTTKNLYNGNSAIKVPYEHYKTITEQTDDVTKGVFNISQIIEIGDRTYNFMQTNNRPPKFTKSVLGNIGYYNLVYTYTRILDVSTADYIVQTCRIYNWNKIHPNNSKERTIYITSDIIYNTEKDYALMKKIKTGLESLGYKVIIQGYGPNSHNQGILDGSLSDNAVQLSIFSGADPGVIYDMCTRSYMRAKESRMVFLVYYSTTSVDITNLDYLKRARDDNYSPASFKGISNPDVYLKDHGYDYAYTNNTNTMIKKLISYIT